MQYCNKKWKFVYLSESTVLEDPVTYFVKAGTDKHKRHDPYNCSNIYHLAYELWNLPFFNIPSTLPEAYFQPSRTFAIELFSAKMADCLKPLSIFAKKKFNVAIQPTSKYTSVSSQKMK